MPSAAEGAAAATPAIADPGPLGLAAFAMTTFVLSVFNSNIISDAKLESVVLPLALFYGGIGQFAAGMWECAWYASFATVTNSTWKRTLLPTFPAHR